MSLSTRKTYGRCFRRGEHCDNLCPVPPALPTGMPYSLPTSCSVFPSLALPSSWTHAEFKAWCFLPAKAKASCILGAWQQGLRPQHAHRGCTPCSLLVPTLWDHSADGPQISHTSTLKALHNSVTTSPCILLPYSTSDSCFNSTQDRLYMPLTAPARPLQTVISLLKQTKKKRKKKKRRRKNKRVSSPKVC